MVLSSLTIKKIEFTESVKNKSAKAKTLKTQLNKVKFQLKKKHVLIEATKVSLVEL
jgi:hypothetical protein